MKVSYPKLHSARPKGNQNVERLPVVTSLDLHPDTVVLGAIGQLDEVFIIGYDHEGDLYCASNRADGADLLWLLEQAKKQLLRAASDLEQGLVS